jgi:hypothetical protein
MPWMVPNGTNWTDVGMFGSTRRVIISGLERGKDIWVRVRAIGGNGPGGWCHGDVSPTRTSG